MSPLPGLEKKDTPLFPRLAPWATVCRRYRGYQDTMLSERYPGLNRAAISSKRRQIPPA